jgi:hypothetical protein
MSACVISTVAANPNSPPDADAPENRSMERATENKRRSVAELLRQIDSLKAQIAELCPGMTFDPECRQHARTCVHCEPSAKREGYWRLG